MSLVPAIALAILVMLVFGSSPIVDLVLKKRREKNGDDVIKEPWVQIHDWASNKVSLSSTSCCKHS